MPENFIDKMAEKVAFWHERADVNFYAEDRDQDMVDYYLVKVDAARDICTMFDCVSAVWTEAKKFYDFTNSGREGYTLRDGKIVKVEGAECELNPATRSLPVFYIGDQRRPKYVEIEGNNDD